MSNLHHGIYYVLDGVLFPTQIIVTKELDEKNHTWLKALSSKLKKRDIGEGFIYKDDFEKMKDRAFGKRNKEACNARNLAAGSIRLLNPEICKERREYSASRSCKTANFFMRLCASCYTGQKIYLTLSIEAVFSCFYRKGVTDLGYCIQKFTKFFNQTESSNGFNYVDFILEVQSKKNREWRHEYMTLLMCDQPNLTRIANNGQSVQPFDQWFLITTS